MKKIWTSWTGRKGKREALATLSHNRNQRCFIIIIIIIIMPSSSPLCRVFIQGGAESTDTFQMAIDNIWKQRKISETVYKYVPVRYLLPTDYRRIFRTSGRWPPFTSMHCCKRVCKLPYTRLRRSSSIAATSTMACLSSWIVTIRPRNTRSFRNPPPPPTGKNLIQWGRVTGQAKRCLRNYKHR